MNFFKKLFSSESKRYPGLFVEEVEIREKEFGQLVLDFQDEFRRKARVIYLKSAQEIILSGSKPETEEIIVSEICQTSLLKYWEKLSDKQSRLLLSEKPPKGWLIETAKRLFFEWVRTAKKSAVYEAGQNDNSSIDMAYEAITTFGIGDILTDIEKVNKIMLFFEQKAGNCKSIFEGLMLGLSYKEIAKRLETTENTIKTQSARCREKAKKHFEGYENKY